MFVNIYIYIERVRCRKQRRIPSWRFDIKGGRAGTVERGHILAVEAVELSHTGEVLVDGELGSVGVLAGVGELDQLVVDGVVGLDEELASAGRLVREAALLDLAVRALASHLSGGGGGGGGGEGEQQTLDPEKRGGGRRRSRMTK